MKKIILLPFISFVAVFGILFSLTNLLAITPVYAQSAGASISGDDACGGYTVTKDASGKDVVTINKCHIGDAKTVAKNFVIKVIIPIGSAILFCFIIFRILMAQKALMEGNVNAYKEASKKIANAIFGFIVISGAVAGFVYVMLQFLGVKEGFLKFLSSAFVEHAYAQSSSGYLPNPIGATNLYDFLLLFVRLFIRWFVYPAVVAVWVWTGFAFVVAQGAPEALAKAKKWLLWALISTILIFVSEGFLYALRGTVNQIVPEASQVQTVGTGNNTTIYQPAAGTVGASCSLPDGTIGQIGTDGGCYGGRGGGSRVGSSCTINGVAGQIGTNGTCYPNRTGSGTTLVNSCSSQPNGTLCVISTSSGNRTGICGANTDGVRGCYQAMINDTCLLPNGQQGKIGANYQCQ